MLTYKNSYIETEDVTELLKLVDSPNYLVSDLRVTTRHMKMKQNEMFPEVQQWVTPDFNPFAYEFDPEVESTEPIEIWDGIKVEHSTEDTFE